MVMLLADMVRTWAHLCRYGVGIRANRRTASTGRSVGGVRGLVRLWWCALVLGTLCFPSRLDLRLNISACVWLSVCGVCSCVGVEWLCALWGVYSACGFGAWRP